jgi:hypothetical protein
MQFQELKEGDLRSLLTAFELVGWKETDSARQVQEVQALSLLPEGREGLIRDGGWPPGRWLRADWFLAVFSFWGGNGEGLRGEGEAWSIFAGYFD